MMTSLISQYRFFKPSKFIRDKRVFLAVAAMLSTTRTSNTSRHALSDALSSNPDQYLSARRSTKEILMTNDALSICQKAIDAVDPVTAIRRHMIVVAKGILCIDSEEYNATDYKNIIILAFGKASSAMATACVEQLKNDELWRELPLEGVVIVKDEHGTNEELSKLKEAGNICIKTASHPVPDQRSVDGAKEVLKLAKKASNDTLVLVCISGGGSALFCEPQSPLTLEDLQETNSVLLGSGLSINDMNIVRKRLETGKGGRLATAAYPGRIVTLVLSDILGDPLDLIASGPTVLDQSTPIDAWRIIQSNPTLKNKLPTSVVELIKKQMEMILTASSSHDETLKFFESTRTILVGNNKLAVMSAVKEAEERGYHSVVLGSHIEGEAHYVADIFTALAQHIVEGGSHSMASPPCALIAGGETTVTLKDDCTGKGGRNQELALAAAIKLQSRGLRNVVLASVGTDGTDGPTDAAGAIIDGGTVKRLPGSAEKALQHHNAYPYLSQIEEDNNCPLIITGPTGTNVADICVVLIR